MMDFKQFLGKFEEEFEDYLLDISQKDVNEITVLEFLQWIRDKNKYLSMNKKIIEKQENDKINEDVHYNKLKQLEKDLKLHKSLHKCRTFFMQGKKYQFISKDKKTKCRIIEFSAEENRILIKVSDDSPEHFKQFIINGKEFLEVYSLTKKKVSMSNNLV